MSTITSSDTTSSATQPTGWVAPDPCLLEPAGRPALPGFPLERLPPTWRQWLQGTALGAGAPVDYVALGLLGAVAGVAGAGVAVQPNPRWHEPLVLWLCGLGEPATGKSPGLAAARPLIAAHQTPERRTLVGDITFEALVRIVARNPNGVALWRDELAAWPGWSRAPLVRARWLEAWSAQSVVLDRARGPLIEVPRFAVSIVGGLQPGCLAQLLRGKVDGPATSFLYACLYAWPQAPAVALPDPRDRPDDEAAAARFAGITIALEGLAEPHVMAFNDDASAAFTAFRAKVATEASQAQGPFAAWLGKGPGTVARLAAVLRLLAWSEGDMIAVSSSIGVDTLEDAIGLWSGYFRPHAAAALDAVGGASGDDLARRVVRWLGRNRPALISREDIRVLALGRTVDAAGAERVIDRLEQGGVLCRAERSMPLRAGRPFADRWHVHECLSGVAANTANPAKATNPPGIELPSGAAANTANSPAIAFQVETVADVAKAHAEVIAAVGRGEMTMREARALSALLTTQHRVLQGGPTGRGTRKAARTGPPLDELFSEDEKNPSSARSAEANDETSSVPAALTASDPEPESSPVSSGMRLFTSQAWPWAVDPRP